MAEIMEFAVGLADKVPDPRTWFYLIAGTVVRCTADWRSVGLFAAFIAIDFALRLYFPWWWDGLSRHQAAAFLLIGGLAGEAVRLLRRLIAGRVQHP